MIKNIKKTLTVSLALCIIPMSAYTDENTELAKKLANPVASLISVPFQYNYDSDIGSLDTGSRSVLNIQPVIPISLNDDWNIISRTILPIVWQEDIIPGTGSQSGLGSVVQSVFFSPKLVTDNGWIWGAGPVFLIPTATDKLIGGDQWGAGPTGVALKQDGPWTYGALANHVWSFADDKNAKISNTFLQPFLAYITPEAVTYTLQTESSYNWEAEEWAVPINVVVSKMLNWNDQRISVAAGVRYWAVSDSDFTPEGWGARVVFTLLFPK